MLSEKTMVVDALNGVNGELSRFGEMIPQTENEMSQEKLYQTAREKSYYVPAEMASRKEIDHVKSVITQLSLK